MWHIPKKNPTFFVISETLSSTFVLLDCQARHHTPFPLPQKSHLKIWKLFCGPKKSVQQPCREVATSCRTACKTPRKCVRLTWSVIGIGSLIGKHGDRSFRSLSLDTFICLAINTSSAFECFLLSTGLTDFPSNWPACNQALIQSPIRISERLINESLNTKWSVLGGTFVLIFPLIRLRSYFVCSCRRFYSDGKFN